MDNLECIINSGLLSYLKKSEYIEAIESMDVVDRTYKRGETIIYEGDVVNRICIVKNGIVRADKNYSDGEVHILSFFDKESIFGLEITLSKRKTSPIDFIANESCQVVFIALDSIDRSSYSIPIRMVLTEMLADENIRMIHKIEILAERGLRDRIMVYMHVLAKKAGSNKISIPMSREQLAQYLRVNRSALSNELSKMRQEGLIDFTRHDYTLHYYKQAELQET